MGLLGRTVQKVLRTTVRSLSLNRQAEIADALLWERYRILENLRREASRKLGTGGLEGWTTYDGQPLGRSILESKRPWRRLPIPPCNVPGMLSEDEKRYYGYITQFYRGMGSVVEIGTWLGLSTFYLVESLRRNPSFAGPLYCFDDFTWRASSMDKWLEGTEIPIPKNLDSFLPLFERLARENGSWDSIRAERVKLSEFPGNRHLPQFEWQGGPVQLCVVDCGRTLEVNNAWYNALVESFLPDQTLIVMQDWQAHKSVPELFWENTKLFTDQKLEALELIHELPNSMAATFLYRGT